MNYDKRCKDIPGIWYNCKINKYIVEKSINGNKFRKSFKTFIEAVGYLNWVLCLHNMKLIGLKVKDDEK